MAVIPSQFFGKSHFGTETSGFTIVITIQLTKANAFHHWITRQIYSPQRIPNSHAQRPTALNVSLELEIPA